MKYQLQLQLHRLQTIGAGWIVALTPLPSLETQPPWPVFQPVFGELEASRQLAINFAEARAQALLHRRRRFAAGEAESDDSVSSDSDGVFEMEDTRVADGLTHEQLDTQERQVQEEDEAARAEADALGEGFMEMRI